MMIVIPFLFSLRHPAMCRAPWLSCAPPREAFSPPGGGSRWHPLGPPTVLKLKQRMIKLLILDLLLSWLGVWYLWLWVWLVVSDLEVELQGHHQLECWQLEDCKNKQEKSRKIILCWGISSTQRKLIIITYPQLAASTIAMQKASVRDVFRKISPCTRTWNGKWRIEIDIIILCEMELWMLTSLTCECSSPPSSCIRSWSWCFSRTSSNRTRLGPSPPAIKIW